MSFQARDNIGTFANVCVELGMRRSDVCNYSNFEKGDLKQITATLCASPSWVCRRVCTMCLRTSRPTSIMVGVMPLSDV